MGFGILVAMSQLTTLPTQDAGDGPVRRILSGRLVAVRDSGRCAQLWGNGYVRNVCFSKSAWAEVEASEGSWVTIQGLVSGDEIDADVLQVVGGPDGFWKSRLPGRHVEPRPTGPWDTRGIWPEGLEEDGFDEELARRLA